MRSQRGTLGTRTARKGVEASPDRLRIVVLLQADRARFADRDGVVHLNPAHDLVRAGVHVKQYEIVGVQIWGGDMDLDPDLVSLHSEGRRAHAHF